MLFNIHCLQDNHYKHDLHNLSIYSNFQVLLTKKQASPRWHPSTVTQKGRKSRIGITRSLRFLPDMHASHFVSFFQCQKISLTANKKTSSTSQLLTLPYRVCNSECPVRSATQQHLWACPPFPN